MKYVVVGRNVLNVFMIQDCMFVYVFVCFKVKFLIDRVFELIDKYSVILFYIIFNGGGGIEWILCKKKKCSFVYGIKIILVLYSYVYVIRSNELIEYIYMYIVIFFLIKDVYYRIYIILKFDVFEYMNECLYVDKVYIVIFLVVMNLVYKFNF